MQEDTKLKHEVQNETLNATAAEPLLLAVDPGREKSGVAVMTAAAATLVFKDILPTAE